MSSPAETESSPDATERGSDRRKYRRHMGKAIVEVIRESDSRRINLPVDLVDISICGIGLYAVEPFDRDDRVKIRLRNEIRKFVKVVHGIVRWAELTDDGKFRIGIELNSRFSSIDMQILKEFGLAGGSGGKIWV